FAIDRRVDLALVQRLEERDGIGNTRLELIDRRLVVVVSGRLDAGEAGGPVLCLVRRDLGLADPPEQVGLESGVQQTPRVDVLGRRKGLCLVERRRQGGEADFKDGQGRLRHREWHDGLPENAWTVQFAGGENAPMYRPVQPSPFSNSRFPRLAISA